ncbi:zinc finger matrin-type protein 5 isoform X1 [Erpetoichthys calabaricus]|uniref:Zinc finger matrin-type protein 5 n=1 Tax=Erpetoichthys calabaricus TaxID=27687 RepID=A0A8C4TH20_ERPCA|nr:zinc finger matrin-type protein 5 isoform X1 [Erpetoichthys calabaricus]XP_051777313.1 zinc finger matrin-type protein 5 isoform X1 [Erpetoichthys calabaricus]
MGKRYYCDYCNRSFQDNLHNRKKHLNGTQHHRAKKAWFDSFRDAATILAEEQTKNPCRRFQQTGQCIFGSNCRFSHMTDCDIERLKLQVDAEKRAREGFFDSRKTPERSIEDWLAKRKRKNEATDRSSILKVEAVDSLLASPLPPHFLSIPDLPASLLPPPPNGWLKITVTEWG